jgi:hypothetical protein
MLVGVRVRGGIPVGGGQQAVTQHPHIPQRETHPAAEAGIAHRRGVTDQDDPSPIRMLDPAVGGVEGREWADGLRPTEPRRRCSNRDADAVVATSRREASFGPA